MLQTSGRESITVLPEHALPNQPPQILTVATTGASGSIFLRQLLLVVERDKRIQTVNFIASDSGLRVLAEELTIKGRSNVIGQILGASSLAKSSASTRGSASRSARASPKIHQQSNADAMIVLPCSVGTLARIAHGDASHLIERAADVCLKEKRPLVLCVRETPLNKIHIRNMYRAADAGATIFPLIPAFYYRPATLDALAREFAYRLLSHVGLPQAAAFRWKG